MQLNFCGWDGHRGSDGTSGQAGSSGRSYRDQATGTQKQERGGAGTDGWDAGNGTDGADGQEVSFVLVEESSGVFLVSGDQRHPVTGVVHIDASGGNGGGGGDGGRGGAGGSGDPPGQRGRDGRGGRGGKGGNGGIISIGTDNPHLLTMIRMRAQGGRGGVGGSGSPPGSSGAQGEVGRVAAMAMIDGATYLDTSYGLNPELVTIEDDGTRKNGVFTAGSRFTITEVVLQNEHKIPMPAPFQVAVIVEPEWVTFEGDVHDNEDQDLDPGSRVRIDTEFRLRVSDDIGVGYFSLAPHPFTTVAGKVFVLTDQARVEERFEFSVNHRFQIDRKDFEEVTDGEWEVIFDRMEGLNPHEQYTACILLLLHPILAKKRQFDDEVRAQEHYHHLMESLEGGLFSLEIHEKFLDEELFQALPTQHPELARALAIEFFRMFDESIRHKLLDCLYFAATLGDEIEARHKEHIRAFGEAVLDDDSWLKASYPAVYSGGSGKVGATSSNNTPALLFPVLPVLALLALSYYQSGTERLFQTGIWSPMGFFEFPVGEQRAFLVVVALLFLGLGWVVRRLLFRTACPRCRSLRLEPLGEGTGSGDGATHRCLDCGARSINQRGTPLSQLHLDCFKTHGKRSFLDATPGMKWLFGALNAVAFAFMPVTWVMLVLMTLAGRFPRREPFTLGAKWAGGAALGFIVVLEVARRFLLAG